MNKNVFAALSIVCATRAIAQVDSIALNYASTITEADLRTYLTELASDAYEGRETGYAGQRKAAAFLRQHFISYGIGPVPDSEARGLVNGYEQPFELELTKPGGLSLIANTTTFTFAKDYFYFNDRISGELAVDKVLFAGYGMDYKSIGADGGVVLVLEGDGSQKMKEGDFFQQMSIKVKAAEAAGARVLLIASERMPQLIEQFNHYLNASRMRLAESGRSAPEPAMQTVVIDRAVAEAILSLARITWKKAGKLTRKPPRSITARVALSYHSNTGTLQATNVLGYIEGSDKKDELVVVTAHYDHIGVQDGEVYNGADDDGSGTVALLEMAQAFARAKSEGRGPRRSVLFMPVSGEEKGLLGSRYYSEHPVFPLSHTVCDLNIDMIGRTDSAHATSPPYVYIIGSDRLSTQLHAINERANATYVDMDLDYAFNAKDDPNRFYFRSDHYNFARLGVPVIFYFSGVHEDYHGPKDEVDRIRFDLLHERTLLIFHTAWILANQEQRIEVDGKVEE